MEVTQYDHVGKCAICLDLNCFQVVVSVQCK